MATRLRTSSRPNVPRMRISSLPVRRGSRVIQKFAGCLQVRADERHGLLLSRAQSPRRRASSTYPAFWLGYGSRSPGTVPTEYSSSSHSITTVNLRGDFTLRFSMQKRGHLAALRYFLSCAKPPTSRKICRSSQSHDGSSGCETSRWEHADYRQAARSPSSHSESSARPGNRSQSESSLRSG
jgi:hypothetical protein